MADIGFVRPILITIMAANLALVVANVSLLVVNARNMRTGMDNLRTLKETQERYNALTAEPPSFSCTPDETCVFVISPPDSNAGGGGGSLADQRITPKPF
jgi:hypothetical protein